MGLGAGFRPREIVHFYVSQGPTIFPRKPWYQRLGCFWSRKYPQEPLRKALQGCFEERRLADSQKRLVILRERIVNWTTNTDVQNRMRNNIEEALYDLESRTGLNLSFEEIDAILEKCLDVARRRYPG